MKRCTRLSGPEEVRHGQEEHGFGTKRAAGCTNREETAMHALHRLVRALALVLGVSLVPPAIPPAHAAETAIVFAGYRAIMDHDAVRQDPVKLLAGALQGLRDALARAGIAEPLADLTAADAATAESDFQARFDKASTLGQGKLTAMQLQYAAAAAMADTAFRVDDATRFYSPESWTSNVVGTVTGLGIVLRHLFGRWVVFKTTPYTPAETAGLRPFDRIVAIDGRGTEGMTGDEMDRLNGSDRPAGTTVQLTILRPGRTTPLTLSIALQTIQRMVAEQHRLLDGGLGYIWIGSLRAPGDAAQFRRSVTELQRGGMRGLILDLRYYSGNIWNAFVNGFLVANTLLPSGAKVQMVATHVEDLRAPPKPCPAAPDSELIFFSRLPSPCVYTTWGGTLLGPSIPLVVIISEDTQGASALLGAAIQDARRGKLVGVHTHGSWSWVDYVALPGGARIGVKTHVVATGRGSVLTPTVGVQPDVPVALTAADLDRGLDAQLQRAVEILSR
jgi:C-terminal processing protease CtpA/Prc